MRLPLLLLGLALASCAARSNNPPAAPVAVVVAFADDFHSGVILARGDVPPRLLPDGPALPWVAVHFGERRWISGEASGVFAALRLAVAPGEGGVQVDALPWWVHNRGGTRSDRIRVWAFPVDQAQLTSLAARLESWIAPGAAAVQLWPGTCWWPAARAWSLRVNCHDFTADLLGGAGIHVARPWIMQAPGLRRSLDAAWAERDAGH